MNRISPLDVHSHHHHSKHDHPPQQGRSLYTPSPLFTLAPLYFVYDHLITIAGKGCVMTGTVLAGTLHVGDDVEFPGLHLTRKVKSIQMFHKNIDCVKKGDRAGVCVQ